MNMTLESASLFTGGGINQLLQETILTILKLSLPPLVAAMVIGVLLSYMQVGVLFTIETIKPKLNKLNPLKGFKNMFSTRSLVELLKSLFKAVLILYVSWSYLTSRLDEILITMELETVQIVSIMVELVFGVIIRSALILFVIAIFDFAFKKWKNKKDIMMTKQEIKDEYKQSEGDPQLKAKIKEKQRAFAMSRMMQEVPKADVVITNPTHYAVAIKYDSNLADAPLVVAKGKDLVAQNIKRIASENNVPQVENKPLAQGLYKAVDIGDFIPPDFYEAVAEVLAYVYNLKRNA
jgi:flagellar biosynthetic protein FlhB